MKRLFVFGLAILVVLSCKRKEMVHEKGKINLVTTTAILADCLRNIVPDNVKVTYLMGPGVDPHLYKVSLQDLKRIARADIVITNGLHLEGKMGTLLEKMKSSKKVWSLGETLPVDSLRATSEFGGNFDPHIWFSIPLWRDGLRNLSDSLAFAFPNDSVLIKSRYKAYAHSLDTTHAAVFKLMQLVPAETRVLVSAHDAFGYFGRTYNIEVKGLQGLSTVAEFGLRDVTLMVNFLVNRKIKAVFSESSVSPKAIQSVLEGCKAKGHSIKLGKSLYSDAMGNDGTYEGTYIGMVYSNARNISYSLRGLNP